MLGNLDTCCRDDESGGGRDIDAVGVVTAGAYDFQHIHIMLHLQGMVPHGSGRARNLRNGLCLGTLGGKGGQVGCILHLAGFPVHDLIHDGVSFIVGKVLLADYFLYGFFDHVHPLLWEAINSSKITNNRERITSICKVVNLEQIS